MKIIKDGIMQYMFLDLCRPLKLSCSGVKLSQYGYVDTEYVFLSKLDDDFDYFRVIIMAIHVLFIVFKEPH